MASSCTGPGRAGAPCGRPEARPGLGLCDSHYRQRLAGGELRPVRRRVVSLHALLAQVRAEAQATGPDVDRRLAKACHRFSRAARRQKALRLARQETSAP